MSETAVDTTTTGDMASALHAAASEAGFDAHGNAVQVESTDDTTQDTTPAGNSPVPDPQKADNHDAPTTPETAPAPQPDPKPKGPIPLQRHEAILKTTREKVANETREAVEREIGPWRPVISNFKPEEFAPVLDQIQLLAKDPVRFYQDLGRELQQAGRLPSAPEARAPQPQPDDREPEPDLINSDTGELLYSAPQLQKAIAWREARMEAKINERIGPLVQAHQRSQQTAAISEIKTAADKQAAEVIAEAQTWEGFDELKPDIAALMRSDRRYSFEGAYRKVFQEKYLPGLKQREREAVVAELKQKGRAGSSGISPNSRSNAAPVTGQRDWDFRATLQRELDASGVTI